jgi:hypothetical protein
MLKVGEKFRTTRSPQQEPRVEGKAIRMLRKGVASERVVSSIANNPNRVTNK